jgi:hypothetical protein
MRQMASLIDRGGEDYVRGMHGVGFVRGSMCMSLFVSAGVRPSQH